MDADRTSGGPSGNGKDHYAEAIVLATKVAHAPNLIGEICISDDPDYVTGYVASKTTGYTRITKMKELGSENGGRIFLYRGRREDVAKTISFLEKQPVIVRNIQPLEVPTHAIDKFSFIDAGATGNAGGSSIQKPENSPVRAVVNCTIPRPRDDHDGFEQLS